MKLLFVKISFLLIFSNSGDDNTAKMHTEKSGNFNLATLEQIEDLISKKAGAEFRSKNTFTLNGHSVYTKADINRFAPDVFEESFFELKNPDNEYRIRLVKHQDGTRELAVLINGDEGFMNCHAAFDSNGIMFEEDPWGTNQGYTIQIFEVYEKYCHIFAKRVDGLDKQ